MCAKWAVDAAVVDVVVGEVRAGVVMTSSAPASPADGGSRLSGLHAAASTAVACPASSGVTTIPAGDSSSTASPRRRTSRDSAARRAPASTCPPACLRRLPAIDPSS